MVESAPLLREYTLIAYRGFESLSLRQTKKLAPHRGAFFWSGGERGLMRPPRFDKMSKHFGPENAPCISGIWHIPVPNRRRRLRRRARREMQSRLESIPSVSSQVIAPAGLFFGSGGERGLKRIQGRSSGSTKYASIFGIRHLHAPHRVSSPSRYYQLDIPVSSMGECA